ncbi:MAG: DUF2865 domain-containing protein [Rhizobiaceae bacterium]|nr:DUF2865 domain-containing protein [Rhizobiaceae bacterium]
MNDFSSFGLNSAIKLLKLSALAGALMFVSNSFVAPATAQTNACLQLQNQLSSLSVGGNRRAAPSKRYRQYDQAVKNQKRQISKTQRMSLRNGCAVGIFGKRNSSTCRRIKKSIDQMSANLADLERERRRLAPRQARTNNNQRNSIIRAMNRRGCFTNRTRQRAALERPRKRSIVEQLFGLRTYGNDGQRGDFERPTKVLPARSNTYRTMCVRKKDGYYFPISFSTTQDRFNTDEQICQAKCQGTDVALYYHAMPSEDSEDMISFRGQQPYADLPTAFSYRKKFDPDASCRYSSGVLEEIAGSNGERINRVNETGSILSRIGAPIFREDREQDSETLANLDGQFGAKEIKRLLTKQEETPEDRLLSAADKKIRVVGPTFYPVQQAAKSPPVPDRALDR